jgi:hypothetical protein
LGVRAGDVSENSVSAITKTDVLRTYPNPFRQSATISYELTSDENVTIKVFSITGKEVATLQNGKQRAGAYMLQWNASELQGGVYIVQMKAGDYSAMSKMMLIK